MSFTKITIIEPQGDQIGHTVGFVKRLANLFREENYEVSVWSSHALASEPGFKKVFIENPKARFIGILYALLKTSINISRADRVLFSSCDLWYVLPCVCIFRRPEYSAFILNNYGSNGIVRRWALSLILLRLKKAFVYSARQREILLSLSPDTTVEIVPHYSMYSSERKSTHLKRKNDLGYFGNNASYKRFPKFLEVADRLYKEANGDFKIVIYGDISGAVANKIPSYIECHSGYITENKFHEAMLNTKTMFLGHDSTFSNKVSGLAFHGLSFGCRLLASSISPFEELSRNYSNRVLFWDSGSKAEELVRFCKMKNSELENLDQMKDAMVRSLCI